MGQVPTLDRPSNRHSFAQKIAVEFSRGSAHAVGGQATRNPSGPITGVIDVSQWRHLLRTFTDEQREDTMNRLNMMATALLALAVALPVSQSAAQQMQRVAYKTLAANTKYT